MDTNKDLKLKSAENRAKAFSKIANQHGIHYSSLPIGMSRNKLNQSNYSKKFPQIKPFAAFFENLLLVENPQGKGAYSTIRHQVKLFVDAGIGQFNIALKKEKSPRGHFVDVSHHIDLLFKDVLKGEQIIEYPIFYVWLKSQERPSEILVLEKKRQLITTIKTENESGVVERASVDNKDGAASEEAAETNDMPVPV
ncbi:hypothetical protein BD408DRAFT_353510 [Parasitella parasitica]|nr:hypothetical protein BD408DRAFT_353510 [Parasitella parasitica]